MKEFKDKEKLPEGWKRVKLGEVVKESLCGEWGQAPIANKNLYPVITTLAINYDGKIDFSKVEIRQINKKEIKKLLLRKFDILIEKSGGSVDIPAGKVSILKDDFEGICSNFIQILRIKEEFYPVYLFYKLLYDFVNKKTEKYQQRTTNIINFKINEYFNEEFYIPPLPEQQKIAEILETVDKAIEKTDKIIEKYKRIKQGLMQELLTKGIDEEGNIRSEKTHKFKDSPVGRIPVEWEVKRLGEVFIIRAGGDISKLRFSKFPDKEFRFPIYSNTIENKGLYGYANTYTYPENSITVTGRGTLGFAVPRFEKFNAIIRVLVLIPKCPVNIVYVSEYINSMINFEVEMTGVPQLTAPKISKYLIPLPPLPEQQRIAEILSQVDKAIEKEQNYKEKLQRLKQGLMEDLLTGKVRVNNLIEEGL